MKYAVALRLHSVSRLVIAGLLVAVAVLFTIRSEPASARCTKQTTLAIAERVRAATDDLVEYPALALSALRAADDDLHACFVTTRASGEGWSILVLHEQVRIEAAGALASEGHLSASRSLLASVHDDLRSMTRQANKDKRVLSMIATLRREADVADDVAHNQQRLASMKVAGNRLFSWPTAQASVAHRPIPAATPQSCARPNVPATTIRAVEPDTPAMAQQQNIQGTVQVIVALDASSNITGTRIQSSPSATLNSAALSAARQSKFQTEIRDCKPIPSTYIFSVDFPTQ